MGHVEARKIRISRLYERLLDTSRKDDTIPNDVFQELKAKFVLEEGISQKTFGEYIELLSQIGFISNNWNLFFENKIDWADFQWFIHPKILLPFEVVKA
jgi:hypothetical protein